MPLFTPPQTTPTVIVTQRFDRSNGRFLRRAAEQYLGDHDRKTDDGDADQIYQDKRTTTVFAGDVGKLPDVPQTDRRTGRRKNETELRSPVTSVRQISSPYRNGLTTTKEEKVWPGLRSSV